MNAFNNPELKRVLTALGATGFQWDYSDDIDNTDHALNFVLNGKKCSVQVSPSNGGVECYWIGRGEIYEKFENFRRAVLR